MGLYNGYSDQELVQLLVNNDQDAFKHLYDRYWFELYQCAFAMLKDQHAAKDILQEQKENGVDRKLVGFEMIDKGIPRNHYELKDQMGAVIGYVTSGTQSPSLGKAIGMGYVDNAYAKEGSEIFISIRDNKIKAKVVKPPFTK